MPPNNTQTQSDESIDEVVQRVSRPEAIANSGDIESIRELEAFFKSPGKLEQRLGEVLGTVEIVPGIPASEIVELRADAITLSGVYVPRAGGISPARVWRLANHDACIEREGVTYIAGECVPELLYFERIYTFGTVVSSIPELQAALEPLFEKQIRL